MTTADESSLGVVKLTDFGLCGVCGTHGLKTRFHRQLGTPHFFAPELDHVSPEGYDAAVDVWALGLVFYEALTGRLPPSKSSSCGDSVATTVTKTWPSFPRHVRRERRQLIRWMLSVNPGSRPTAAQLKNVLAADDA